MEAVEILDGLIKADPDYQELIKEVNTLSYVQFPDNAESLEHIRKATPCFDKLELDEFFARFKCMVVWSIFMGRVVEKIHGTSKYDDAKAFDVGMLGKKKALIYYEGKPHFYIDRFEDSVNAPMYVTVPLKVSTKEEVGVVPTVTDGEITFSLTGPSVIYNPLTDIRSPKLLNSVMDIKIKYPGGGYVQPVSVRNFNPGWLSRTVELSGMGDN